MVPGRAGAAPPGRGSRRRASGPLAGIGAPTAEWAGRGGAAVVLRAGNKIYYYRCLGSDNYRYEHGRVCDNKPVRTDYLDKVV